MRQTLSDSQQNRLNQSQEALLNLKQLLSYFPAEELAEHLDRLILAYLISVISDDVDERSSIYYAYLELKEFLTKTATLNEINRFKNF